MNFRYLILMACVVGMPLTATASNLETLPLPDKAEAQLSEGDVYVKAWHDDTRDDGAIDLHAIVDIQAPKSIVWLIMTDCERTETIVPDMKSCKVIERGPNGSWDIREQKTKVNFLITHTSVFRSDYVSGESITISRAGGDMKVQEGLWQLDSLSPSETRLTYRAATAPSFPISKSRLIESSKKSLPIILDNLRNAAESDFALLK